MKDSMTSFQWREQSHQPDRVVIHRLGRFPLGATLLFGSARSNSPSYKPNANDSLSTPCLALVAQDYGPLPHF